MVLLVLVLLEMQLTSSSSKWSQQVKQQQGTQQWVKQQQVVKQRLGQQEPAAMGSRGCQMAHICLPAVLSMSGYLWWGWCTLETA
jgi:hypothetical protein